MNAISDAVSLLQEASRILDEHANNPRNYNSIYANDFEIKAWEIYKHMVDIKEIQNRYGVL